MNSLILLFISILPVFLIGSFIYLKDRNREPFNILSKLFIGGLFSTFLTLILYEFFKVIFPFFRGDFETFNLIQLIAYSFLYVALIEEFSKWIFVYFYAYNSREFDEIYDMIVYAVFVALGFAFLENILYVFEGGVITGIFRALLAVPGHAADGVLMGYFLGLAKQATINERHDLKIKYFILSLVAPIIAHGTYDYLLFTNNIFALLIFFILVILFFIYALKKVKQFSMISGKLFYQNKYCTSCGTSVTTRYCPKCGNLNH